MIKVVSVVVVKGGGAMVGTIVEGAEGTIGIATGITVVDLGAKRVFINV